LQTEGDQKDESADDGLRTETKVCHLDEISHCMD
jgi:hypothetical protein